MSTEVEHEDWCRYHHAGGCASQPMFQGAPGTDRTAVPAVPPVDRPTVTVWGVRYTNMLGKERVGWKAFDDEDNIDLHEWARAWTRDTGKHAVVVSAVIPEPDWIEVQS